MQNLHREVWIDWLRLIACFMVLVVHSTEPFYLGGDGALIQTKGDMFWFAFFEALTRACVPLFVVASAYLQFPVKYSTGEFFRKRAGRILIPFLIWTLVYAFVWGNPVDNFKNLLFNFNYAAGHLWFVYMLVGLYLLMPLLSPWAEKVGKNELRFYILLCIFTSLIPVLKDFMHPGPANLTLGPSGIPMPANYPLWGEASWNPYGLFYYFSGFLGYMLIGLYVRKFLNDINLKNTLYISVPCLIIGMSICLFGVVWKVGEFLPFPISRDLSVSVYWERYIINDTIGVYLITIGMILLIKQIRCSGKFYEKVILPVSNASYGMYLSHLLLLVYISQFIREKLGIAENGIFGDIWTTPVEIVLTAVLSFVSVAVICVFLRKIPKIGKWIIG